MKDVETMQQESETTEMTWEEANQRYLAAALNTVLLSLERHVQQAADSPATSAAPTLESAGDMASSAVQPMPVPSALELLCSLFHLSPFERDILLLCAGMELDAAFARLCAAAQGGTNMPYPTFGLALAALREPHWSALAPQAPLRYWRLIDVPANAGLTTGMLRIDERILHYLTGINTLDERLAALLETVEGADALVPSHQALAERLTRLWSRASGRPPLVQLCGAERAGKRDIAYAVCRSLGLHLFALSAYALPVNPVEFAALVRLWEREALLFGGALLLDAGDLEANDSQRERTISHLLETLGGFVILCGRERRQARQRPLVSFDVGKPTLNEQRDAWRKALGQAAHSLNGKVEALTMQFDLNTVTIASASVEALGQLAGNNEIDESDLFALVWDTSREQARPRLDDLAQRIAPSAGWDDLVLPEPQRQVLRDIAIQVRQRATVYEAWGFAARTRHGLGINALFAGASGTSKTMAAEGLANELRLDLYRIDLSQVVSKYIGETEKNLRRVFDAAEEGGALLLFDEADALFGKRSEVKDSHDRYANIEVSYLLQRMEAYRGLAILTTNLKNALDTAFLRRLRFIVHFPFPDAAQRAEIWRRIFPPGTPTAGLDIARLARLNVTGGTIRNIALNAAFLAADAGEPVRMQHLLRATRSEYAKLEKALTDTEIGGWA